MNYHPTPCSFYFCLFGVFLFNLHCQTSVWSSSLFLVYFCGSVTAPPAGLFKNFPLDSHMPFYHAVFKEQLFSKKTELIVWDLFLTQ